MRPSDLHDLAQTIRRFAGCDALGCLLNVHFYVNDLHLVHELEGVQLEGTVRADPTRLMWKAQLVADAAEQVLVMHMVGDEVLGE